MTAGGRLDGGFAGFGVGLDCAATGIEVIIEPGELGEEVMGGTNSEVEVDVGMEVGVGVDATAAAAAVICVSNKSVS